MFWFKQKLESVIRIVFKFVLGKRKPKDIIVFESHPDYSCNTFRVFEQLRAKLPNYKMVWYVSMGTQKVDGVDDLFYWDMETTKLKDIIKYLYYQYRSKVIICCNRVIPKGNTRQLNLDLEHGSFIKKMKGVTNTDYVNIKSHFFDEMTMEAYSCSRERLVYLGYPRCDYFYMPQSEKAASRLLESIGIGNERFSIWLPTFRQTRQGHINVKNGPYDRMGMPIIYDVESLSQFNSFLQRIGMHILYKPHPAQNPGSLRARSLSNIHVITDETLKQMGAQLYQVIAQSAALITDYSSVFYDYLLLDRPIAITDDDVSAYRDGRGFMYDVSDVFVKSAILVENQEQLQQFLTDVVNGVDIKKETRGEIRDLTNMYCDGNSAQRVTDFVLEKIKNI